MDKIYISQTILILFLGSVTSSSFEGNEADNLPTYAVPSHYSLYLTLDPEDTTYNGSVQIDFSARTTVNDVIKLHASPKTIKIHSTLLNYNHSCTVTSQDNDTEIVILTCPTKSFRVQNTLVIRFQGKVITEDQVGLFRTTYKEDGDEHVMLSTEFEPVDARQAFPCFDEPKWKTTFDIFITHPKKYIALANTPVKMHFPIAPDRIQTQFQTTPLMSVYLLAFAVSKFVSSSDNGTRGYDYRVFTRPGAKDFISVAVTYGPILINLLGNWTGIAYKDLGDTQAYQIAIPNVDDGAMENWGLITYGEVDLLDEKEITSNSAKQDIIAIIAHELAHQWFGNYVTMNWWSNIWLNEGYATYFQHYIVDQLEDDLEMMKQFVVNIIQPVLEVDAVSESLPLSSDVNNRADSEDKFDDISYSKGASIIRMLRNVIGEAAFREGIRSYLSTYKYNNTHPSVLLNSFKTETPLGLDKIMYNWIYKAGFPLVTARLNGSTVTLTQERFDSSESTQWYIPITYTTKTESNFNDNVKGWLVPNSTLDIELEDGSWIILNMQQTGYYRVNYDDILWQRIIEALKNDRNSINVINRSQLVNDVFNIARAGGVSYRTAFHLAEYLRYETEYYPWVSAFNAISFISGKLADNKAERLLQFRILYWLNKAFPPNNPNTGTSHVDKLKEVLVLDWACKLGQEQCIAYANETFQKYKTSYSFLLASLTTTKGKWYFAMDCGTAHIQLMITIFYLNFTKILHRLSKKLIYYLLWDARQIPTYFPNT
ncbi:glutamyl aminopeptidase-like isoform X2 [Anoplophora glabripennis]|uniref:glutamyl aminopeptidase-like isoform X2 n=1 Tax=Anoplophora glabripennis TaxID=217634 RepID=UPI000873D05E|nr:glutamyl aminopeptidase-like isoform X2 [Anoplophora glabripennis]